MALTVNGIAGFTSDYSGGSSDGQSSVGSVRKSLSIRKAAAMGNFGTKVAGESSVTGDSYTIAVIDMDTIEDFLGDADLNGDVTVRVLTSASPITSSTNGALVLEPSYESTFTAPFVASNGSIRLQSNTGVATTSSTSSYQLLQAHEVVSASKVVFSYFEGQFTFDIGTSGIMLTLSVAADQSAASGKTGPFSTVDAAKTGTASALSGVLSVLTKAKNYRFC